MRDLKLTNSDIISLQPVYTEDSDVVLDNKVVISKEGVQFTIPSAGIDANDVKMSNHSTLILTDRKKYSDIGYIQTNKNDIFPEKFVTHMIWLSGNHNKTSTHYNAACFALSAEQLGEDVRYIETVSSYLQPLELSANSNCQFEIELIDEQYCRVSHDDGYKTLYMSGSAAGSVNFQVEADVNSAQKYLYVLDRVNNFFTLSVKDGATLNVLKKEIGTPEAGNIHNTAVPSLTAADTGSQPPELGTVFKVEAPVQPSTKIVLTNDWVAYEDDLKEDLVVDPNKIYKNVSTNILINSEYHNNEDGKYSINFIPLKNYLTPRYHQSRNNPFPNYPYVDMREYTSIFADSNQVEGGEQLNLGFESYVRDVTCKQGKLTYFHMPQTMYPYRELNVRDCGLIESGAVGGSSPLFADKIFKKRAGYKENSSFGDASREQHGEYLCSWLYEDPRTGELAWLDRYFNTAKASEIQAIGAGTVYTSETDTILTENPDAPGVFDKYSTLTLEAGVLYAYYHIGQADIDNIVNNMAGNVNNSTVEYQDSNGNTIAGVLDDRNHLVFDFKGAQRAVIPPVSAEKSTNSFTFSFVMDSNDWKQPFGHQLMGNYTNKGFGVFNKQNITPFVVMSNASEVFIMNSDFKVLNTIEVSADMVLRTDALDNIYALSASTVSVYDIKGNFVRSFDTGATVLDAVVDDQYLYVLLNTDGLVRRYDLLDPTITDDFEPDDAGNAADNTFRDFECVIGGNNIVSNCESISVRNGRVFVGIGYRRDLDINQDSHKLIRSTDDYENMIVTNIADNSTAYQAVSAENNAVINDVKIDSTGAMWVIYGNESLLKVNKNGIQELNKEITTISPSLSSLPLSGHKAIDFLSEWDGEGYKQYLVLLNQEFVEGSSPLSADTTAYYFNLNGGYVKQQTLPVNLTQSLSADSFKGFTNYSRSKILYNTKDSGNKLIFKIGLRNILNSSIRDEFEIDVDLMNFKPGPHHFAYIANNELGVYSLYIDGKAYKNVFATVPGKFSYNDVPLKPIMIGASPFNDGEFLHDRLDQAFYYSSSNFAVKLVNLFSKAYDSQEIGYIYAQNAFIRDLQWAFPAGKRGYVETISKFFKHRLPGHKTNLFTTHVMSPSGIQSDNINEYDKYITDKIAKTLPINVKKTKSTWLY